MLTNIVKAMIRPMLSLSIIGVVLAETTFVSKMIKMDIKQRINNEFKIDITRP